MATIYVEAKEMKQVEWRPMISNPAEYLKQTQSGLKLTDLEDLGSWSKTHISCTHDHLTLQQTGHGNASYWTSRRSRPREMASSDVIDRENPLRDGKWCEPFAPFQRRYISAVILGSELKPGFIGFPCTFKINHLWSDFPLWNKKGNDTPDSLRRIPFDNGTLRTRRRAANRRSQHYLIPAPMEEKGRMRDLPTSLSRAVRCNNPTMRRRVSVASWIDKVGWFRWC
jgi:hypothetical protein